MCTESSRSRETAAVATAAAAAAVAAAAAAAVTAAFAAAAAAGTESTESTTHLYNLPAVDHADLWATSLGFRVARRCRGFAARLLYPSRILCPLTYFSREDGHGEVVFGRHPRP